ncbi:MAG: hypothetical protein JNL82_19930 [Myxococcales bacterium]|nr:hypothetical protein [Myxococcales bacterium]
MQSEPAALPPSQTEDLTPNYVAQVPEARGVVDLNAFDETGTSYTNRVYGAGVHGATAAHANHLRNGDFGRGVMFWQRSAVGIGVSEADGLGEYVVGGRSLRVTSSSTSDHHLYQEFSVDDGVRTITVMVRYAIKGEASAFRLDVATVSTASVVTEVGYYSDTDNSIEGWRVRALTVRFDGTLTGVAGPRRFRVRLYPYHAQAGGEADHSVLIDSVWVVDGEYAAPYRPYQEGVEVLAGDDRAVLFGATGAIVDGGPSSFPMGFHVPTNAVGMVTEMSISSASPTSAMTSLRVDDGTGTDNVREIFAVLSNRATLTEYTVPLVPGASPTWSTTGAAAGNA